MDGSHNNVINPEFCHCFGGAVQQAVVCIVTLVSTTPRSPIEIRQNGTGGNGDQPPTIHTWLERLASYKSEGDALNWWKAFKQAKGGETYMATLSWKIAVTSSFVVTFFPSEQQKYEREYHTIRQRDGETSCELMKRFLRLVGFVGKKAGPPEEHANHFKWALCDWILDGIVNTKFTIVAQVANAARNMEILHERPNQNNKRNRDGDLNLTDSQIAIDRGYIKRVYDGRIMTQRRQATNRNRKNKNGQGRHTGSQKVTTYRRHVIGLLELVSQCGYDEVHMAGIALKKWWRMEADHEYQNCPLCFDDKIRFANLLPLEMSEFDISLGMNMVDCFISRALSVVDNTNPCHLWERNGMHPRYSEYYGEMCDELKLGLASYQPEGDALNWSEQDKSREGVPQKRFSQRDERPVVAYKGSS
ncbi:zinc finger, CCHC-type, retrotransposon gag domain protein [Tanacetum coccineum]